MKNAGPAICILPLNYRRGRGSCADADFGDTRDPSRKRGYG